MKRLAWVLLLVSCGARTDLGGAHADGGGPTSTCSAPLPAPASCTAWHAGSAQAIGVGALADATASGCGVLVAWYTSTATSIAWSTRWVDYDGAMLASPLAHPSLAAQTTASAAMSLAEGGMLEDDATGCRFVTVDASGHEEGTVTPLGSPGCRSLARSGSRWSFLRPADGGGGSLVVFESGQATETPLSFAQPQYIWDRVVLADGSFLVSAFWEDANTVKYTNWLTPFDAQGGALGPSVPVLGFESAPVLLARAGNAAIAAWQWSTVDVMPVDAHGQQVSSTQTVTTDQTLYELSLFTQPNGDVLVTWIVLDENTNDMSLHARVVAPDGTPRGPATLLATHVASNVVRGAIESSGARALLAVTVPDGTIDALPLTCD